tara:strand:+ start:3424 stop:4182 length:759 start_codon:yes stop_codon:yes gene_type:complete
MSFSLNSISTTRDNLPPRCLIYGVPGIGKSTFGASLPAPIFIQCESGLGSIDTNSFPLATSFDEVAEQLGVLMMEDHDFKTVVIDTTDALEHLIMAKVCQDHGVNNPEDIPYGKSYVFAVNLWQQFLHMLDALRNQKNMMIMLLCHSAIRKFNSPIVESYDKYELALHKNATALLIEWLDILGFANYQVFTKTEESGFNKKISKAVGTGIRRLHLSERPAFLAKNRYAMPDEINFNWHDVEKAMNTTTTTEQ